MVLNKTKFHRFLNRTSINSYSTHIQVASIDDLRASILQKSGLEYINNTKLEYKSVYNWKPCSDILKSNNKMKNIEQLSSHDLLNDVPAVLSPLLQDFDLHRMQQYRLDRIRQSLRSNNCDVGLFFDPTNIRYITDVPNMQVWVKGNPFRYVAVSADERDPLLLFEFKASEHLGTTLRPDIIETAHRSKVPLFIIDTQKQQQQLSLFITDLMQQIDLHFVELRDNKSKINLSVDVGRTNVLMTLMNEPRLNIMDGFGIAEKARLRKNNDEYLCLKLSCEVANIATYRMREYLHTHMANGDVITDNEIFAILSGTNVEYGGEYLECKLLGSGQKSNPWYQESSNNPIQYETLLSFDTDMVGPFGYCADFSRCFYTGNRMQNNYKATDEKFYSYCKSLYNLAFEQVQYNMNIVKPGLHYKELQEKLWKCPAKYFDQRYTCVLHGVGSCDEYPVVMQESDGHSIADDAVIEAGTCLSVESYIGEVGGKVGVKLEDQIFVNENGIEVLSTFPYERNLLIPQY